MLYLAEAGQGGTTSTDGQCDQVVPPVGPYTSGSTSRISMIDASGARKSVVEGLPSAASSPAAGGDIVGASDVVFVDDTLYYTLAGAGCSHGVADVPNGVYRVEAHGTTTLVADTSAFVQANPTAKSNPGDFEPDGEPYSIGTDEQLASGRIDGLPGLPTWSGDQPQEFDWTAPEGISQLKFGCTLRGHYQTMQGTFSVSA